MELQELQVQIKKEFNQYKGEENLIRLYYWMFKEYKNHASLLVSSAKETLDKMIVDYPDFKYHFDILLKHINTDGSLEAFFNIGLVLSNASPIQNDIMPLLHYTKPIKKTA